MSHTPQNPYQPQDPYQRQPQQLPPGQQPPASQPQFQGSQPAPWQPFAPAVPGVSNGPVLDPSPMDLGGVFRSASNIFKQQPGLLLGFGAAMVGLVVLLALGVLGSLLAVMGWQALVNIDTASDDVVVGKFLPTLLTSTFVAVLVGIAAQVKLQAMTLAGADQIASGYRATWGTAHRQSRGVLPRAAALVALGIAVSVAVMALFGLLFYLVGSSSQNQNSLGFLLLALIPVFIVVSFVLWTRFAFVVPVLAIEGRSGMDVLRRSWDLTSGRAFNVFGRLLLGNILVSLVAEAPARIVPDNSDNIALILTSVVLTLLTSLASSAWQTCYQVAMYRDERSRTDVLGKQPVMAVGQWNQQPPQQSPWTPQH